jgi:hypothetical protein
MHNESNNNAHDKGGEDFARQHGTVAKPHVMEEYHHKKPDSLQCIATISCTVLRAVEPHAQHHTGKLLFRLGVSL